MSLIPVHAGLAVSPALQALPAAEPEHSLDTRFGILVAIPRYVRSRGLFQPENIGSRRL